MTNVLCSFFILLDGSASAYVDLERSGEFRLLPTPYQRSSSQSQAQVLPKIMPRNQMTRLKINEMTLPPIRIAPLSSEIMPAVNPADIPPLIGTAAPLENDAETIPLEMHSARTETRAPVDERNLVAPRSLGSRRFSGNVLGRSVSYDQKQARPRSAVTNTEHKRRPDQCGVAPLSNGNERRSPESSQLGSAENAVTGAEAQVGIDKSTDKKNRNLSRCSPEEREKLGIFSKKYGMRSLFVE